MTNEVFAKAQKLVQRRKDCTMAIDLLNQQTDNDDAIIFLKGSVNPAPLEKEIRAVITAYYYDELVKAEKEFEEL